MSKVLAPESSNYHPSRYAPSVSRPVRQVVSGGGTWFSDRSRRVDFRPDGSPKTCSHDAAVAAQRARVGGVAWHRSPDRTFAHGILTFCGDDTHTLDMPAAPVDGNLQALAYASPNEVSGFPRAVHLGARQQDGGTFASPASSCSGRRTTSSTSSRHSESLKAQRLAMLQSGELPSWAPFRREQHTGAPPPHPFTTCAQQQLPPPPQRPKPSAAPFTLPSGKVPTWGPYERVYGARGVAEPPPSSRQPRHQHLPPAQCLNGHHVTLGGDPGSDDQDEASLMALDEYTELTTGYMSSDSVGAQSEPQSNCSGRAAQPESRNRLY